MGVHASFQVRVFVFLRFISRSGIAGLYGNSIFSFLRNSHIVSIGAAPIYIATNKGVLFLVHFLGNAWPKPCVSLEIFLHPLSAHLHKSSQACSAGSSLGLHRPVYPLDAPTELVLYYQMELGICMATFPKRQDRFDIRSCAPLEHPETFLNECTKTEVLTW